MDLMDPMDNDWPTASSWLASWLASSSAHPALVVAGVPVFEGAVTPSRYDLAPSAIRARLDHLAAFDSERGVDLRTVAVRDLGDDLSPPALGSAELTVLLGGHNAVTWLALG